jgi:hypothetical protein
LIPRVCLIGSDGVVEFLSCLGYQIREGGREAELKKHKRGFPPSVDDALDKDGYIHGSVCLPFADSPLYSQTKSPKSVPSECFPISKSYLKINIERKWHQPMPPFHSFSSLVCTCNPGFGDSGVTSHHFTAFRPAVSLLVMHFTKAVV